MGLNKCRTYSTLLQLDRTGSIADSIRRSLVSEREGRIQTRNLLHIGIVDLGCNYIGSAGPNYRVSNNY